MMSVLSAGPLIVFTFFYFVVPEILTSLFLAASMKICTNCADFSEAVPESIF
jgi:hypothetical protein